MEAETAAFGYPSRARISRPAPSSAERRAAVSQTATQPVAKCSNGSILEPERFAPIEVTTFLENRFRVQRFPAMRYRGPFPTPTGSPCRCGDGPGTDLRRRIADQARRETDRGGDQINSGLCSRDDGHGTSVSGPSHTQEGARLALPDSTRRRDDHRGISSTSFPSLSRATRR